MSHYTDDQLTDLMDEVDTISRAILFVAAVAGWFAVVGAEMARAQGF